MDEEVKSYNIIYSVVSHGHGNMLNALFEDLKLLLRSNDLIILTLNIPENLDFYFHELTLGLNVVVINNKTPKGFGANHNSAFKMHKSNYFAVINPDIRLQSFEIDSLIDFLAFEKCGVVAPLVCNDYGLLQDSFRKFPTLFRVIKRRFKTSPDYKFGSSPFAVDWVAGMFMLFDSRIFQKINGFNESYFLYLEDADICRRLSKSSHNVFVYPQLSIVHNAQRQSHRSIKFFLWHLKSLFIFFINK